jgi:hypothetical protein
LNAPAACDFKKSLSVEISDAGVMKIKTPEGSMIYRLPRVAMRAVGLGSSSPVRSSNDRERPPVSKAKLTGRNALSGILPLEEGKLKP